MKHLIFLFLIFLLGSCNQNLITEESLTKERSFTDHATHYYIYPKTLPGLLSTEYYKIKAYLVQEDSHFILFSHFNSFKIEDGIKIKFERDKTALIIKASVKNASWKSLFQQEDYFLKSSELDLTIEVQNGTPEGAHIQIWENFRIKNNVLKLERKILTKETLLTDSGDINFYRQGEGLKWGLKLFRTRLLKGVRVSPALL